MSCPANVTKIQCKDVVYCRTEVQQEGKDPEISLVRGMILSKNNPFSTTSPKVANVVLVRSCDEETHSRVKSVRTINAGESLNHLVNEDGLPVLFSCRCHESPCSHSPVCPCGSPSSCALKIKH